MSNNSDSVFHYTTAGGVIGILQNQTLHATHADFLNDASECKIIKQLLLPALENDLREVVPELINQGVIDEAILAEHGQGIYSTEASTIFESLVTVTNRYTPFFIASFCAHAPHSNEYRHGLLSQWRGYGLQGGFAIEFDRRELDQLLDKEGANFAYSVIRRDRVVYRDHENHIPWSELDGLARSLFCETIRSRIKGDLASIAGLRRIEEYYAPFVTTAPFLKDGGFAEEQEYRIVAICFRRRGLNSNEKRSSKPIRFKTRGDGSVIPYIELFEGLDAKLPIQSVIVGPHKNQSGQKAALEVLLEQKDLDVEIRTSSIPYRD